jgi:sirohydrochlorin ferrochelatase
LADGERAAALLQAEWGPWVSYACLSGAGPNVSSAVEQHRRSGAGRVCVAPYLLAPGRFSHEVRDQAVAAGATVVAPVLGGHRLMTDLILRRYAQGLCALAAQPSVAAQLA